MLQASVRVVRFGNRGARETHELAVCEHHTDDGAKLWFADRVVDTTATDIAHFHVVNEKTYLSKATVFHAVQKPMTALRAGLPVRLHQVRATRACATSCPCSR